MAIQMESDWRHLKNGLEIPTQSYSDQPYIVKTDDGAWLCCVTTGPGHEGVRGQHVTTMRSTDQGRTWSVPVPMEAPDSPENSYAVMLKVPSGRIYIFYNHNTDNVREVKLHNCSFNGKDAFTRVDGVGHFVFKYSDDHGRSWSGKRYDIPFRLFKCDRENVYGGKLCFFWNVGKPFVHEGGAFVSLHKVGQMGEGFYQQSEGVLLKSDNMLFETDPEKIRWETLPDGDTGLRTPPGGGPISEEQSYVVLSDGSFHVTYRSIDGYPVESYSRDGGHTWSPPKYKCFPDGRRMKNPRAANFAWKCKNGKYMYWFHNHGGHFIREMWGQRSENNELAEDEDGSPYDDRNPAWLCGGVEADSPEGRVIKWSEPEIVLYDDDPFVRISYPDLIEEDGRYFLSETQKDIARIHEIPTDFVNRIWAGLEMSLGGKNVSWDFPDDSLLLDVKKPGRVSAPRLPDFFIRDCQSLDFRGKTTGQGFAIEMALSLNTLSNCVLIEGRREDGRGLALNIAEDGRLELIMNDGWMEQRMSSEPCLNAGKPMHIVVNVDGGPRIVSFIVNVRFCDGGEYRQFGWQRFSPFLRHVNWCGNWEIAPSLDGKLKRIKVHSRTIMTAEAVRNRIEITRKKTR
ncbi:MAG: sialidase family protein [Lentisphaerae bacterium]|nr:sialidase family protein [Lentisphaerota bacterium]